ncbi:MAG: DUF2357 domain-containing protein [Clostridia bacterium]|nr:DUF2357 domain-containing protein [Clostridia bacterium]
MAKEEKKSVNDSDNKESLIDPIYQKFVKGIIRAIGSTEFYEFFMDAISRADNEFQFSNRKMEKLVDLNWVDAIDETLDAFQTIISSPRNVIKEEELIVNVANAKKAGSEVVRHLAQHSALVENFDADTGDVRPGRLMQRYREDSIGLYENRLVFTTMEYAYRFVKIRHDALFEAMSDEFGAKLKVRSDMQSATEKVHLDMFLHIRDIDDTLKTDSKNFEVFSKISKMYRVLSVFMNSSFAEQLSKLPRVKGTINKTNILKKNKNYKQVLKLFDFMKGYSDIGYTIKVIEQNPKINKDFQRDIYHNIMFNYLILKGYLESEEDRKSPTSEKGRKRTLRPKFIKEIIEELTENYDLPDVEVRKVLIEELTKADLMKEEAAERRRLVEEREQRKKEEAERKRAEKAAEKERIRAEKEAEREKKRREKQIEEERKRQELAEREIEDRRRGGLFRAELKKFHDQLPEQRFKREEATAKREEERSGFEDAAAIVEETDRLKREERDRLRQQRKEEQERLEFERIMEEKAVEEERRQIIARQQREQEEKEAAELAELIERDKSILAPVINSLNYFSHSLPGRLELRRRQKESMEKAEEERQRQRRERIARKTGSS